MNSDVVEVEVKGTLPTNGGCAVFIGNEEKWYKSLHRDNIKKCP